MKFVRALVAAAAAVFCAALFLPGISPAADKVVTIGYQKYGNLILLKGHGGLESSSRHSVSEWTGGSFRRDRRSLKRSTPAPSISDSRRNAAYFRPSRRRTVRLRGL